MAFCRCGCEGSTEIASHSRAELGWVAGQPKPFLPYHGMKKGWQWNVVETGHGSPCWLWMLGKSRQGYGAIWQDGRTLPAHRVIYETLRGEIDAPALDHLCGQVSCVNPDHLEPVSIATNTRRGKGTILDLKQVGEIKALIKAGWVQADIARAYRVSQQIVCDIKRYRRWVAA